MFMKAKVTLRRRGGKQLKRGGKQRGGKLPERSRSGNKICFLDKKCIWRG